MNRWQSLAVLFATMFLMTGGALAHTVRSGNVVMDSEDIQPGITDPNQSPSSLVELLVNPGFETGALPPWTTSGGWSVVNTGPHSGNFCAYDVGNNSVQQNFAPINTANVLSVSFWARQPQAVIQAYDFLYSDNTFDEDIWFPAAAWGQKDITYLLRPAGAILTGIRIWGYFSTDPELDETFIDDVTINVAGATPVELSTWGEIKNHFR